MAKMSDTSAYENTTPPKMMIPLTQSAFLLPFHAAMHPQNTASTSIEQVQMTSNYARSADGSYAAH